jgi:phosphoribosyl-ATP pyrophosphohydrolase
VGENRNVQRVLVRQPETIHLIHLGKDGRITVKWILKRMGEEGMDWIPLAQDRDKWQALVDKVIDLRCHTM